MTWNLLHEDSEWLFRKLVEHSEETTDSKELQQLAEKLKRKGYISRKLGEQQSFNYQKAYKRFTFSTGTHVFPRLFKVAVIILVIIGSGILYFLQDQGNGNFQEKIRIANIHPGNRKAFLIKHDGEKIALGDHGNMIKESGVEIHVDTLGIFYQVQEKEIPKEIMYNTLVVPRGGEYSLALSDGTKVWLNAGSELKYPIYFSGETREVYISGEAYFDVKKKEDQPFIVRTNLGDITVLGTEFNVQNYLDDEQVVMTLVKGKISYKQVNHEQVILLPGQQLVVKENGTKEINTVDTRYSPGWKNGMFFFRAQRLEEIMEQLERWYDVHVFYTNEAVKDLHFTGDLSRFKNIDTFIEMFEQSSDVKFDIQGKNLFIGM